MLWLVEQKRQYVFFCQGIGDCHLLKFPKDGGGDFWMLIDCGIHSSITGGTDKIKEIVKNIRSLTARLDLVVLTHEHWDHNSGFLAAKQEFQSIDVGELWMGWTEDPHDPQARQLDKFKGAALTALQEANGRLDRVNGLGPHLSAIKNGLEGVLGSNFGAKRGKKFDRRAMLRSSLQKAVVKYLEPKTPPISVPELAKSVRIYVLGPPRDAAMLGIREQASEMYGLGVAGGWPIARALGQRLWNKTKINRAQISRPHSIPVKDAICPSFDPGTVSLRAIRSLRRLLNFCMRFMMAQQIFAHRAGAAVG